MKKICRLAITLAMVMSLFTINAINAHAVEDNPMIRVGLFYGSNALPTANLQNVTGYGSGYQFGYFNSSKIFVPVASTSVIEITMMKDKNIYLAGGSYYDTMPAATYSVIGAYHIQLATVYTTFDQAKAAAAAYTSVNAFPAYCGGKYYLRVGSYTSSSSATSAMSSLGIANGSVVGASTTCYTVTETKTTTILFEFDGGSSMDLVVSPVSTDPNVMTQTWFKGYKYYGTFEYKRLYGEDLTVINYVTMQQYLKGVIPYEMSASWPVEALKAQTLCAKNYAAVNFGKHSSSGFDVCNTTHCQVYHGTNSASSNSDKAVDDTYGMYVYYNGSLAQTVYSSSDGGATEDAVNVWGYDYPYLRSVVDNYESTITIPGYNWSYTYTKAQITAMLQGKGYDCSNITEVYISAFTNAGNVYSVTFVDDNGDKLTFSKESARTIWSYSATGYYAKSQRYTIAANATVSVNEDGSLSGSSLSQAYAIGSGGVISRVQGSLLSILSSAGISTIGTDSDSVTITGTGSGHNVGMSQYGAKAMAQLGYTYQDIIKFYYTGVTVS